MEAWFIPALHSFGSLQRNHARHPPTHDINTPPHTSKPLSTLTLQINAKTTHERNLKPRTVQELKRRQSGEGPVGDCADPVGIEAPASADHRVSKCSRAHRIETHPHRLRIRIIAPPHPPAFVFSLIHLWIVVFCPGSPLPCARHVLAHAYPMPDTSRTQ
jgi:hypothetical protein